MAGRKAKGIGGAGCCCGGCRSVPNDSEAATTEIQPIQQYCCRCIPNLICVSVTSGYGTQYHLVERICGGIPNEGAPVQYRTNVVINGNQHQFNVRLDVRDEQCFITWDIPDLELSGERLIDPEDKADPYSCNHGMNARACAEFGGEWELEEEDLTIRIVEPSTLDLRDLVDCGGCNCICRCLCFSVYSRDSEGVYTLVGSNDIVCAELSQDIATGCGEDDFFYGPWRAAWTNHGWTINLGDRHEWPIASATVEAGTEDITEPCEVQAATWKGDGREHSIIGSDAQVVYEWNIGSRVASSLKWVGRSHDEGSEVLFEAYNWVSSSWQTVAMVDGRPDTTTINRALTEDLEAAFTGTGGDEGKVKIRLTLSYGTSIHTDMIRIVTHECCKWSLTPPNEVELASTPAAVLLTGTNRCPDPSAFWELAATDGTDWFISIGCSWCGSTCGSVSTFCCPRPIGNVLFAEIDIDCPTCAPTTIIIPLTSNGTGALWEGSAMVCGDEMQVSLVCSGSDWQISVSGAGACSFSGSATSVSCDPLLLEFSGVFGGGLGCCGPSGDPFATPSISIAVIE